jgi:hypothetical protein
VAVRRIDMLGTFRIQLAELGVATVGAQPRRGLGVAAFAELGTTWLGRVSTWPARMPGWSYNAFTAASRRGRRIDQDACCCQNAQAGRNARRDGSTTG